MLPPSVTVMKFLTPKPVKNGLNASPVGFRRIAIIEMTPPWEE